MILEEGTKVKTCSGMEGIVVGKFFKEGTIMEGWFYHIKDVSDGAIIPFHENVISEVISVKD